MHNVVTENTPSVYMDLVPVLGVAMDMGDLRIPKLNHNFVKNASSARTQTQAMYQTPAEIRDTVQAKVQENEMNQDQ